MEIFILAAIAIPAWFLAITDSPFLVTYLIATWAFGPEVRRIDDWLLGSYQSVTLLSLIPQASTASLLIPIVRYLPRITAKTWKGVIPILVSLTYGTLVGAVTSGIGAVVEGAGLLLPLLFVFYAAARPFRQRERNLWLRSLSTIAVIVAAYGWVQFLLAPPWDMFWLVGSRMTSSMGNPQAMEFRVFSSLNAAAPLGLFMAAALVIGLSNGQWRGVFGLIGVPVLASCLLISRVRMAWIMVPLAVGTYITFARGKNRWVSMISTLFVGSMVYAMLPLLPGGEMISGRAGSFANLASDDSAQARFNILSGLGVSVLNPLGHGFGSTGVGSKLTSSNAGPAVGVDNGYVDLATTLGLPMAFVLFTGIYILGRDAARPVRIAGSNSLTSSAFNSLAVAMLIAYAVSLLLYDNLGGVGGVLLWLVVACPLRANTVRPEAKANRRPMATNRVRPTQAVT